MRTWGGTVASCLVFSFPDRAVRRPWLVFFGKTSLLLYWGEQMGTGECNAGDNLAMDQLAIQGGVDASCCRNRDKLWPDEPGGLFADFTFPPQWSGSKYCCKYWITEYTYSNCGCILVKIWNEKHLGVHPFFSDSVCFVSSNELF